ncbi:MAG: SDR family NAD(P)-dependent oxidoreductase [Rhodobacteraceae bacterium]|nr:SDR family NAD(P)-dependent oxidoreductase [Paracoccaceae bacterium]
MSKFAGKRYWLVGASDGLGEALAHKLSAAGAELILSARNADKLQEVVAALPNPARAVTVDVADSASVRRAAEDAGEIDGMVFLAGVYWPMKATEWDPDQAETMADVNFTGAMRVCGAVVPVMVARGRGHIVLTGSLSGFRGLPGSIGYGASKAAVMYLAESMWADLRGSGVQVQVANPGFIRTRLTDKNDFKMPFLMEPNEAAQTMADFMATDRFKRSFPTLFSWLFRGSQFLPDWAYYRIFGSKG